MLHRNQTALHVIIKTPNIKTETWTLQQQHQMKLKRKKKNYKNSKEMIELTKKIRANFRYLIAVVIHIVIILSLLYYVVIYIE